jgi:hypothetical protein
MSILARQGPGVPLASLGETANRAQSLTPIARIVRKHGGPKRRGIEPTSVDVLARLPPAGRPR